MTGIKEDCFVGKTWSGTKVHLCITLASSFCNGRSANYTKIIAKVRQSDLCSKCFSPEFMTVGKKINGIEII
jgi:hypothetical protein